MAREIRAKMMSRPQARNDGGGLDHDIFVSFIDPDAKDIDIAHLTCVIPLDRFKALAPTMTVTQRANLYKALIKEFYGVPANPLVPPVAPQGLTNLTIWETYLDARDVYNAALKLRISEEQALATQMSSWIEGLAAFKEYPFPFVLQAAS